MIYQIVGWIGMAMLVGAYLSVSAGWCEAQGFFYQFLNFFGGAGVAVNAFKQKAWPVVVLECFWSGVAFVTIVMIF